MKIEVRILEEQPIKGVMNKELRHYYRKRQAAIDYLGGKCVVCGSVHDLEFDHIDPSTKEMSISRFLRRKEEVYKAELDKCQLLCYEHHKEKTMLA